MTVSPERAPANPQHVEIRFLLGVTPVAVDGKKMRPAVLLAHLNKLGGKHGIGRVDLVEKPVCGYEISGSLRDPGRDHSAYRPKGIRISPRWTGDVLHLRDSLIPRYAELVYYGYWVLTGEGNASSSVRPGHSRMSREPFVSNCIRAIARSRVVDLPGLSILKDLATFEEGDGYNQKDAEGFIRLNGPPISGAASPAGVFMVKRVG